MYALERARRARGRAPPAGARSSTSASQRSETVLLEYLEQIDLPVTSARILATAHTVPRGTTCYVYKPRQFLHGPSSRTHMEA